MTDYNMITELDFVFAKGKLARKMNATPPTLNKEGIINIKKARHPQGQRASYYFLPDNGILKGHAHSRFLMVRTQ